jgi:hypothetical protein
MIREQTISHRLGVIDSVVYRSLTLRIEQSLSMTSAVESPIMGTSQTNLLLRQDITVTKSDWSFSFAHGLDLQSNVARVRDFRFEDELILDQSMPEVPADQFSDRLDLGHMAWLSKGITSHMFLDTLTLTTQIGFLLQPPNVPSYRDLVCDSEEDSIILVSALDTLTLPPPKHSNVNEFDNSRILRRNRGNELILFADPIWPKAERIQYSFETLTETQGKALQSFVSRSLGKTVTLFDLDGHEYDGIIITPEIKLVQAGRCMYDAEFTFERHP